MGNAYRDHREALSAEARRLRVELDEVVARQAALRRALDATMRLLDAPAPARRSYLAWIAGIVSGGLALLFAVDAITTRAFVVPKVDIARLDCKTLLNVIDTWRMNGHASCPTFATLKADHALRSDRSVIDPWGNAYVVLCFPDGDAVTSAGADGHWGTRDDVWAGARPSAEISRREPGAR